MILNTLNTLGSSTLTQDTDGHNTTSPILTVAQRNISQLVAVRRTHQTKCAAKSVKTRSNPQDLTLSAKPTDQVEHRRLCAQMAEVLGCAGTGLERDARWTQATPGTRGPHETLLLSGNSANAEVVAKERVNKVCTAHFQVRAHLLTNSKQARATRAEHFNRGSINLSRYLADGLVGDGNNSMTPPRLPLKPNDWAFVYWDGGVYVAKGIVTFARLFHTCGLRSC